MTSGSVPPADGQPSKSSTAPTDGPPSEPRGTEEPFPISREEFSATMAETFKAGWRLAKMMTQDDPPEVEFLPVVDSVNRSVSVETIVHRV